MVDVNLALGGSPLLRCSLLTRSCSTARVMRISQNRLLKLGGGRRTDRLAVTQVVHALDDMVHARARSRRYGCGSA